MQQSLWWGSIPAPGAFARACTCLVPCTPTCVVTSLPLRGEAIADRHCQARPKQAPAPYAAQEAR
eukprot:4293996-Alexandrium_andersonii.AAC.1